MRVRAGIDASYWKIGIPPNLVRSRSHVIRLPAPCPVDGVILRARIGWSSFADLAVAVIAGISALVFAWQHAKLIEVSISVEDHGRPVCKLYGSLFFASTADSLSGFTPADDSDEVGIDFAHASAMDHSAVEDIDSLAERYRKAGQRLHLRPLGQDCLDVLTRAKDRVEIEVREDPHYHIADN